MNLTKQKTIRSKPYLNWIDSLPCSITFNPLDVTHHHIIGKGFGGGALKAPDYLCMPVNSKIHGLRFHSADIDPMDLDRQFGWIGDTLGRAFIKEVIITGNNTEFSLWNFQEHFDTEEFVKRVDDGFKKGLLKIDEARIKHILKYGD